MSFKSIDPQLFKDLVVSSGISNMVSSKTAKVVPVGIFLATIRAFEHERNVSDVVSELLLEYPDLLQHNMNAWADEAKEVNKPKKNKKKK